MVVCRLFSAVPFWRSAVCFRPALHPFSGGGFRPPSWAEIAALRSGASTEYPDGMSPKKKAIAAYLREHPGVTNKAKIARDLNMDRTTVQRYYDEIRAELRGEESPVPQT